MTNLDSTLKSRDIASKGPFSQGYGFSSCHVWMWELDCEEGWVPKIDAFELWCWRRLLRVPWTARRSHLQRRWDGWMESLTWWTWVWVNSGSWWWTGRPGVLQFMGSQRVGYDWVTKLNWMIGQKFLQTFWTTTTTMSQFLQKITVCVGLYIWNFFR